jgi:hypothetical protein
VLEHHAKYIGSINGLCQLFFNGKLSLPIVEIEGSIKDVTLPYGNMHLAFLLGLCFNKHARCV